MQIFMLFTLVIILNTGLNAAVTYKTPNMVVTGTPMYCTDYYGKTIVTVPVGDIVGGERASTYCSYNKSTVKKIQSQRKLNYNERSDQLIENLFLIVISLLGLVLVWILFSSMTYEGDTE